MKLNEEKTEFIVFIRKKSPVQVVIRAGENKVTAQEKITILGVTLDRNMILDRHVVNICRCIYMNIRKIRRIKLYLSDYAIKMLVQTTVTVRLDHCNS